MSQSDPEIQEARRHRRRFSLIWLIPIAAAVVALYLGYNSWNSRGPLVTLTFQTADGITAGQTKVRYKAVDIGTVESIRLTGNLSRVSVKVRMARDVEDKLTDKARFWIVRPRLTAGNISGLETIVSGAYIEFDPGIGSGEEQREFEGLSDPPGIRSDEPGRIFVLHTQRIGALSKGSPVYFRDVQVGEILSFDEPGMDGVITMRAFIRSPFEGYLRAGSRFWNTSGVSVGFGPNGVKLELESLKALLAGGIAFDTPERFRSQPKAPDDAEYTVYEDADAAFTATSPDRIEFIVYPDGDVSGLTRRSAVVMRGIRIGSVQSVDLAYDKDADVFRVPVRIAVEPDRIAFPAGRPEFDVRRAVTHLVQQGLRASLKSGNLLTGQKSIALDFHTDAPPAEVREEDGVLVLPSLGGDSDDIMGAISAVAGKLQNFPLDEIGRNLNSALASVSGLAGGPELKGAISSLADVMKDVRELVQRTDNGLTPLLRRLPQIANNLDQMVARANSAVGSIERGYGGDSAFNRQLDRMMQQVTDAARSVRMLTDYLDRHPEALIRGRTD
ncbi:MCE family protein [Acetobacteraceae bacterium H6797]|nr:MCE family protein [Acetobacteraceae bacterium H6797]